MPTLHPLAAEANDVIRRDCPAFFDMLSAKGREIYFPRFGILGQTAEAKATKLNATIGIATEDNRQPMHLASMDQLLTLPPSEVYPYASSFGVQALREMWQRLICEKNPSLTAPISLPIVTSGITHALSVAGYLFIDPGDELIVADCCWDNYSLIYTNVYGAEIVMHDTFRDGRFAVESLQQRLSKSKGKKRVVLFNFPNNPAGYTPLKEEVVKIVDVLRESAEDGGSTVVILDDAYFGLVYEDGVFLESLLAPLANLSEHLLVVKVDGATKEDYVWGHRIGFVTFGGKGLTEAVFRALESKAAGVVRATVSNAPHVSQSLLLHAYTSPTYAEEKRAKLAILRERYQRVCEVLESGKYDAHFHALPFNSGYFMCVQLREGLDADAIRKKLIAEYDTGVIALGNLLRVAFSSVPAKDIEQLFENIASACAS
ncbi:MAG: aminotransferase class I/II-fold pyridoxal phosphate-dependent enzyme [Candidatus Peregrinibacteria bacterium]|nr:aminotransferase class I/II-fold pyridoxal phosphate-dependent enzyme [Candidatus Peregrinibacteria bacterium]